MTALKQPRKDSHIEDLTFPILTSRSCTAVSWRPPEPLSVCSVFLSLSENEPWLPNLCPVPSQRFCRKRQKNTDPGVFLEVRGWQEGSAVVKWLRLSVDSTSLLFLKRPLGGGKLMHHLFNGKNKAWGPSNTRLDFQLHYVIATTSGQLSSLSQLSHLQKVSKKTHRGFT